MNLAKFSITRIKVGLQYIIVWETSNKTLLLLFFQFETDFKEILEMKTNMFYVFQVKEEIAKIEKFETGTGNADKKGYYLYNFLKGFSYDNIFFLTYCIEFG